MSDREIVLPFLQMRRAALLVFVTAGCTAPNPAFGDATSGGSAATDAASESTHATSQPTSDTTRGADATSDDTSTSVVDPSIATSDEDSGPRPDAGNADDDGSTTEASMRHMWLFSAAVDTGAFGDPAARDPLQTGLEQCAAAYQSAAQDVCLTAPIPIIRTDLDPFGHPVLAMSTDAKVLSLEGDSIAETVADFLAGVWVVGALHEASGGGLELLSDQPLATGGRTDGDPNCGGWLNVGGNMTLGNVLGGDDWFSGEVASCQMAARILCICPAP